MDGIEFFNRVQAHADLEWLGCMPEANEVYVAHSGAVFAVPLAEILADDWDTLEAVLLDTRPARALTYLARIVGYFSSVRNWNKSKLSELVDRGRGTYAFQEKEASALAQQDSLPEVVQALASSGAEVLCQLQPTEKS